MTAVLTWPECVPDGSDLRDLEEVSAAVASCASRTGPGRCPQTLAGPLIDELTPIFIVRTGLVTQGRIDPGIPAGTPPRAAPLCAMRPYAAWPPGPTPLFLR
jgi:hypothetical protein